MARAIIDEFETAFTLNHGGLCLTDAKEVMGYDDTYQGHKRTSFA